VDTEPVGKVDQLLVGPAQKLGIGREGDVLGLHGGVDNDAGEICGLHRPGACANDLSLPTCNDALTIEEDDPNDE
jgi:hypothetical protein